MQADLIQISVENTFMDRDGQRFNKCPRRAHFSCFLCRSVAAVHPGGARTSRAARELRQDPLESHEVSGGGERGEVHHQIHSASDRTLVRRKEVRAAPIEARVFGAGVPQETAAFDAVRKQTGRFSSDVFQERNVHGRDSYPLCSFPAVCAAFDPHRCWKHVEFVRMSS